MVVEECAGASDAEIIIVFNPSVVPRERLERVLTLFRGARVAVRESWEVEDIVFVGRMFATTDVTRATALLRRQRIAEQR